MKTIDEAGYTWIYFAPFHDIIKENLEYSKLRNYEFVHLKGKEQEGVCFVKEYREYVAQGINITPFCESRCPYRYEGCNYYETKDMIESYPLSWAGVHAHIPTYLQSFFFTKKYADRLMYNHYDVIIIDEFPFSTLFNQVIINKGDVDELRNVISYIKTDTDEKFVMSAILDELMLTTKNIDINYSRIKNVINDNRGLDFQIFMEEYDGTLLSLISHKVINKPPKNLVFNLATIYKKNPTFNKLKWNIYKHNYDGWNKTGTYITTSNIEYFQNLPIPIIALDATADINAWNTLMNDKCRHMKIDMTYKNLYQMRSNGRYPVSTWITVEDNKKKISETGKKLCDLIIKICKRKKYAVLLCSNKRIQRTIQHYMKKKYRKKNYQFAIFYNLRSRNEFYQKCDTCIITHEPNVPPLQFDILSNIIGWDNKLLRELMTTSEIKQGIGRIRQNIFITPSGRKRENIETFMLPGVIREDQKILDEAKLISYDDMYVGRLLSVRDYLMKILKKTNLTTLDTLSDITKDVCSYNILKSEVKRMWKDGYISNYKNSIQWVWDEEKAKQIIYNVDG